MANMKCAIFIWCQVHRPHHVQPWEYPAWFTEWAGYAQEGLNPTPRERWEPEPEEKESFIERSSVIHMLMMAQEKIPSQFLTSEGRPTQFSRK